MEKQETDLLDQAIAGVERLIVRYCELADAALCMSAQVRAAPVCGRIEALEGMKEDDVDQAVRNISRLTVDLERMKRIRERDEAPSVELGAVLELSEEDLRGPVVTPDKETQTVTISTLDGMDHIRLTKKKAMCLAGILIDQSKKL